MECRLTKYKCTIPKTVSGHASVHGHSHVRPAPMNLETDGEPHEHYRFHGSEAQKISAASYDEIKSRPSDGLGDTGEKLNAFKAAEKTAGKRKYSIYCKIWWVDSS